MEQSSSDDTEASDGRLEELLQQSSRAAETIEVAENHPVVIKVEQKETKEACTGTEDLQTETAVQTQPEMSPTSPAADSKSSSRKRSSSRRKKKKKKVHFRVQ